MWFRRRLGLVSVLLVVLGVGATEGRGAVQSPQVGEQVYAQIADAVFLLEIRNAGGELIRTGSGFLVGPDLLITNAHVTAGGGRLSTNVGTVTLDGEVVRRDAVHDLALVRLSARLRVPPLALAETPLLPGMVVFVVGSPHGFERSISQGLFSGDREMKGRRLAQISAPISPGSSGSPVVNERGEVVGMVVSMVPEGQSLNFAIPADMVRQFLLADAVGSPATPHARAHDARSRYVQGLALLERKDVLGALFDLRRAVDLEPSESAYHKKYGEALRADGDREGAMAQFREAIGLNADDAETHRLLADVLAETKDGWDRANEEYRAAVRLRPDYPEGRIGLGRLHLMQAFDASLPVSKAAAGGSRKTRELDATVLGVVTERPIRAAVSELRKAVELRPQWAQAHSLLGFALELSGEFSLALAEHETACGIDPTNTNCEQLERVREKLRDAR